jgi:hypothetical protein
VKQRFKMAASVVSALVAMGLQAQEAANREDLGAIL